MPTANIIKTELSDKELLEKDSKYCSWGDTVHYNDPAKIFRRCEGSFVYDENDIPYMDVQMWHSACNFGYKNKRIEDAVLDQIKVMPQLGAQFINQSKVLLSEKIAKHNIDKFGHETLDCGRHQKHLQENTRWQRYRHTEAPHIGRILRLWCQQRRLATCSLG